MCIVTILIADDASFIRSALKFIVEGAGHTVIGMSNDATEAVQMYKDLKPDLVMLDIMMKATNGIEALKEIMTHDPKAKVMMISAMAMENTKEECLKLGASGFIRKPFSYDEITTVLQNSLSKS